MGKGTVRAGAEVQGTYKLTEEVAVTVDFTVQQEMTYEELEKECRDRLERAGLDRNLEELDF